MSQQRVISQAVLTRQRQASDPDISAWVSANAGSGKTHVLAQRVIRLLLRGVDPARILCITFTKAAAGTMANRVFNELRRWTSLDDKALIEAMKDVGAKDTGGAMRARARKLFALALETPGGLKVQTIHAFCTHILHRFPFEADVAARFAVLDEVQETQLLDRMTNETLLAAANEPQSAAGRALTYAIGAASDLGFRDMIVAAIDKRDEVETWLNAAGGLDQAAAQLSQALGLKASESEETLTAEFFGASLIEQSEWAAIAEIGAGSGKSTDQEQGRRFASLPMLKGAQQIERYIEIFCTKTSGKRASVFTGDVTKKNGALCERLHEERDRIWSLIERRRALAARDRTMALVTIAKAVLDRFQAEKDRRGELDFEDQIDKAHDLLSRVSAAWVHYKLDRGIDHVLIDEAQDTSPKQWGIVRHLVAEFFAGKGASDNERTIFAVGDEKQSIFSFQGAAPAEFDAMRREFARLSGDSAQPFEHLRFDTSLRSGANVLSAVDLVFKPQEVARSLTLDVIGIPEHIALKSAAPGEVEIWDTEKPLPGADTDPWDAPFDTLSGSKPVIRLAQRIAKSVKALTDGGSRAGDVLILVNRRGALFEAIIRALKNERIPVAGADRLVLIEHIAVMDLLVLADALLLPQDDLALATALKSPLFGLTEEDIYELAHARGTAPMRAMLAEKAGGNPRFAEANARLDALATRAKIDSPFAFYAHLLGAEQGRKRFLARLGHEAADALDEFLNLALDYERGETPSLQGFVSWLRAAKSEVKRDMEMDRDEVRVMTVHGAKGLEAPVVYLTDTTTRPEGHHPPPLLTLSSPNGAAPVIWMKGEKEDIGPMNPARVAARAQTRDEYRRLLYVGMTRAARRLVVCGVEPKNRPAGCWYDLVFDALKDAEGFTEHEEDGRKLWRYRKVAPDAEPPAEKAKAATLRDKPHWLTRALPAETRAQTVTPSAAGEEGFVSGGAGRLARLRGNIAHRLLQSLPDIPAANRTKAANDYIARTARDVSSDERRAVDSIADVTLALLADERFAALFAPGSRAEVPIVGELNIGGKTVRVSGQIDRLVVTQDTVLIGDFKTGAKPAQPPESYVRQLALYRAVLAKLYPQHAIRAALVWAEVPELTELSAAQMDAALAGVTSA